MLNRHPLCISLIGLTVALAGCASTPCATLPAARDARMVVPHGFAVQQAEPQGQPLTAEQAQQQLPGRISADDASRMLVFINPDQVATGSEEAGPPASGAESAPQ